MSRFRGKEVLHLLSIHLERYKGNVCKFSYIWVQEKELLTFHFFSHPHIRKVGAEVYSGAAQTVTSKGVRVGGGNRAVGARMLV